MKRNRIEVEADVEMTASAPIDAHAKTHALLDIQIELLLDIRDLLERMAHPVFESTGVPIVGEV